MMDEKEIERLSTPEELFAEQQWKRLAREAKLNGFMDETALLEASEAIGLLVQRNKRLGLIK